VATAVFGSRSVAVDVRPLIPRNHTNLWAKAEQVRDALHDQLSRACQAIDIEPLLLSSSPFVYPAWVKFEAWQPVGQQATTRRSSAIITVDPKPYHEHPFELEVTYSARGKTRTIKRVKPLTDAEVQELVEHLVREGPKPSFRRFREAPLQFWREKNELVGLRRDRLAIAATLLVVIGFALVAALTLALALWAAAGFLFYRMKTRRSIVRNEGKPDTEPRSLIRVDSWQTVVFNLGREAAMVRERFVRAIESGLSPQCRFRPERVWYWSLDGKEEREQLVVTGGRGVVFCQIYNYGNDLYVGWDGHLNRGQWVEQTVSSGIDRETGSPISITRVVPGTQPTTEYDLADLSCLMEWTHAQIVKLLKQLIAEREIDQEIDFKIQRAERENVVARGAAAAEKTVANRLRKTFQRTA